ncbi:membrane fusion protein, cobalt-zinc-cadmium efflux system [Pseudarcicella hirudinis]|uniref:Membrane fusion protein, cobalt-zinc-cadmium efflux system n=1 Tax=Pseudarcicella hirudinis TaxID=1079859 RepID=A0A1I5Z2Y7_9BACT|nr:efflux RND transporter periplasmic adaptor subunit [Pseudarcicella hirudinis]SFQ50833.1 membrane fusion protein, cobalt-zinc-cadmium efflux system [Pseudarcicella hirudinis]
MKLFNNILIISALSSMSLASCSTEKKEDVQEKKSAFELSQRLQKELVVVPAEAENVSSELQLTGKVVPFEQKQVKVSPLVDGVIEKLSANLGDFVKKDQILAIVHSSDVADVENQTVSSKSDLLTAQKNVQVQQDLYKSGLASEKDVTIAQNELLKAQGALRRANEVSGIYGVKNSFYTLKAPITGYVVDKNNSISEKMAYHEGDTGAFFTIADLSNVQVVANVYESDIAKIKIGYAARIKLLAYPDKIFTGKIDKISNALDPQTRTMQVRINIPNEGNLLKPEMFAQITIDYASNQKMVSIPAESIIFDKNKNFVIVYKSAKQVETREIQVAQNTKGKAYIFNGLTPGEMVMGKNQLMIYNALTQ